MQYLFENIEEQNNVQKLEFVGMLPTQIDTLNRFSWLDSIQAEHLIDNNNNSNSAMHRKIPYRGYYTSG
jgi:hypothetical protein